jgi:hypothetical protein
MYNRKYPFSTTNHPWVSSSGRRAPYVTRKTEFKNSVTGAEPPKYRKYRAWYIFHPESAWGMFVTVTKLLEKKYTQKTV